VRKLTLIPLLIVAVLALAACGGGGSSSSGGSETTSSSGGNAAGESASGESAAASPEAAWAKEITGIMSEFENKVSAQLTELIHTSTAQEHLEPLYATYSTNLTVLADKLEKTNAPAACVAVRKQMVDTTRKVAALTKSLSGDSKLNAEQYAAKGYNQGLKIDKLGHQLGALTAKPSC
jgi:hypothetical protein